MKTQIGACPTPQPRKKRILLINDDVALTDVLKVVLDDAGDYLVEVESLASRVLDTARQFRPDVIALDEFMPEVDGNDLDDLLKGDCELRHIPIVEFSALKNWTHLS